MHHMLAPLFIAAGLLSMLCAQISFFYVLQRVNYRNPGWTVVLFSEHKKPVIAYYVFLVAGTVSLLLAAAATRQFL
jgi:hypothetical protein